MATQAFIIEHEAKIIVGDLSGLKELEEAWDYELKLNTDSSRMSFPNRENRSLWRTLLLNLAQLCRKTPAETAVRLRDKMNKQLGILENKK